MRLDLAETGVDLPNSKPRMRCNAPTIVAYRMTKESRRLLRLAMVPMIRSVMMVDTSSD